MRGKGLIKLELPGGRVLWMSLEEWEFEQNWTAMREWAFAQAVFQGCAFDDPDLIKAAHEKFGIEQPTPTPSKILLMTETPKINTYTAHFTHGIDDMWSLSPYHGEWGFFSAQFDWTEDQYKADEAGYESLINQRNESYKAELISEGLLGLKYHVDISMVHNAMFDEPTINGSSLDSYRMVFLDNDKLTIQQEAALDND